MPDVNVPVVGKTPRGALVAGLLAVVGVSGYLIYKHYAKSKTTTPATAAQGAGYGYGYGATAGMGYGYGGAQGVYGFGGGGFPWGSYGYGGGGGPQPITTNAQWGQAAEAAMGSSGNDTIAAAIAKYLAGQQVTQEQELTIEEAIAVVGPVPVPGPGNYPPQIHVIGGGPGGGGGGITGLTLSVKFDNVTAHWNPVSGATGYTMNVTTHQGAQNLGSVSTTSASGHVGHLPQRTDIAVHVVAQPNGESAVAYTRTR